MDFGFVHGKVNKKKPGFPDLARDLIRFRRPVTTLVDGQKVAGVRIGSLRGCVQYLTNSAAVLGDLFLGSHANASAVAMPMFNGQEHLTEYETLELTIADDTKSIELTDLLGPPQSPPTHKVQIFGCNIGKSNAFLTKWKEALGGNVKLIAPRHFDGLSREDGYGVWEFLCYEFSIAVPKQLKFKRPVDMRNAFKARTPKFGFVDGSDVPDAYWDNPKWYAPDISRRDPPNTLMTLAASIGPRRNAAIVRGLRVSSDRFRWGIDYQLESSVPNTKDPAACLAALRASLLSDERNPGGPRFVGGHAFPMFVRYGYADLDQFIAGFTWRFEKVKVRDPQTNQRVFRLQNTGERVTYTLIMPITSPNPSPDPHVGAVKTNFHPNATFNKVPIAQLPPDALDLADSTLYATV